MEYFERKPEAGLKSALQNHEMEMYLQFLVSASEENIIGAEALIRWNRPGKGIISPGVFSADQSFPKISRKLDLFVFENVCRKLSDWHGKGWTDLSVSCNFSRVDFQDSFLTDRLFEIAGRYEFDRSRLIIEVTEEAVEDIRFVMIRSLRRLRKFGFRIALDDFGAGGSSIRDIQMLPLDIVKLDRSLLQNTRTSVGESVFRELTGMVKRLQYTVVCEGVETEAEMEIAREAGADAVQGFLHYVPIPEREADRLLEEYYSWSGRKEQPENGIGGIRSVKDSIERLSDLCGLEIKKRNTF